MLCSTIREIIVRSAKKYSTRDAIRYKKSRNEIEVKSYQQLKEDSEKFSAVLKELGELGKHIALTGMTSYEWIVAYLGITNSGSVAVPLDVSLPAEEMCELIDRADATVFVADEIIFKRDLPICIGLTALLTVFLFDGALNCVDGLILLVLFFAYIAMTVVVALKGRDKNQPEEETKKQRKWWLSLIFIAGGLAGVIFGGDLVVDSASKIALNLGMSEALVGLTIVALGTSLPELVTSITAARKGDSGMALGNVVGSNIFNLLLILGSSSVLSPIGTNQNTMVDILFCLGVTIFTFVAIALCKKKVNRPVGIAMVLLYIAYMIFAILR